MFILIIMVSVADITTIINLRFIATATHTTALCSSKQAIDWDGTMWLFRCCTPLNF